MKGQRLSRWVLRAYPQPFRDENGPEILADMRRLLEESGSGTWSSRWLALRLIADLVLGALLLRLAALGRRGGARTARGRGRAEVLRGLLADGRDGWRSIRSQPTTSLVAVTSLALGIGANVAIFGLVDTVLLRSLPVERPDELVSLHGERRGERLSLSFPVYESFAERQRVFTGVLVAGGAELVRASRSGEPLDDVRAEAVSGNYFEVLGVVPRLGRFFGPQDDVTSGGPGGPLAVLSYGLWQRVSGGRHDVVGERLELDGVAYTVAGVAPAEFFGATVGDRPDVWLPMHVALSESTLAWRTGTFFETLARLRPGISREAAEAQSSDLFRRLLEEEVAAGLPTLVEEGESTLGIGMRLEGARNGFAALRRAYSAPLRILMAVVGLVLLIACCNVANLQLARGAARAREIGTRLALGAGRARLVRQLLVESTMLSAIGGGLGLLVAHWGSRIPLTFLRESGVATGLEGGLDLRVLLFTAGLSLATGVLFGLAPALQAIRLDVVPVLKTGTAASGSRSGRSASRQRFSRSLVVTQLALSLLLLVGAGLLLRSVRAMHDLDLGFDREQVLLASVSLDLPDELEERNSFVRQMHERLESIPGVEAASFAWLELFSRSDMSATLEIDGWEPQGDPPAVRVNMVSPGYFDTLGVRRLAGRDFSDEDAATAPRVALVNESFRRTYFGERSPLGGRLRLGGEEAPLEIVGVYEDFAWNDLRAEVEPMFFLAAEQWEMGVRSLALRARAEPVALAPVLRDRLRELDAGVLVRGVRTLSAQVDRSISQERILTRLSTAFGALGLFLACVGLYGVLVHAVVRRTSEIAVRVALGARQGQMIWMVMRETLVLVLIGVLLGLPGALALGRALDAYLFGLNSHDPSAIVAAVVALTAMAVLAGYLPARRASRVPPVVALRQD